MTAVSAVMIAYNDEHEALTRLVRDLLPSLWLLRPVLESEIVVIDNSERRLDLLAETVMRNGAVPGRYCWNRGRNLLYGPSLNAALRLVAHPILLYLCASHGRMHDPTWVQDLIRPIEADPAGEVAMCGTLAPSGRPSALGFPDGLEWLHVQGGVFAARADALRAHPYPEHDFCHWGADVYASLQLAAAGYRLVDVPTVCSVWRSRAPHGPWKYVHEEDS